MDRRSSVNRSKRAVRNNRSDAARAREYRSLRYKHITQMDVFLSKSPCCVMNAPLRGVECHATLSLCDQIVNIGERESGKSRNLGRESQTPI
jgi:hypothetical protein